MHTRFIEATGTVVIVVACLSAPVLLQAIGSQFRIAARLASPFPVANLAKDPTGNAMASIQIAGLAERDAR